MSEITSTSQSSSTYDPYGTTPSTTTPSTTGTSTTTETGSVYVTDVGYVTVMPPGEQTSPEVQAVWNEQMAIITDIMAKLSTEPPTVEAGDLDLLVGALKELETLATEGITDEDGVTYYLTEGMAKALDAMLLEFKLVGITTDLNVAAMSDSQKIALLTGIAPPNENLSVAVTNAEVQKYEDLGFQTYVYTALMDMINATSVEFEELETLLNQSNEVLGILNDLIEISSYTEPPDVWEADMTLDDPGDIPPTAVAEIQQYIEDNDGNEEEQLFAATYQAEYDAAYARSIENGTTVEEEMHNAEQYPPYVVTNPDGSIYYDENGNTVRNDVPSSSDLLQNFIGNGGDEEKRTADIGTIMMDSVVTELESVPTAPEGMTMSDVAMDIWASKEALEEQIVTLRANGEDDLADSLQKVVDDIDDIWAQTQQEYGFPPEYTPEDALADGNTEALDYFATEYILYTQPGEQGSTNLDNSVVTFQSWSDEIQKDFQVLVTYLDSLVQALGEMLKIMDDIYSAYIKNYAA